MHSPMDICLWSEGLNVTIERERRFVLDLVPKSKGNYPKAARKCICLWSKGLSVTIEREREDLY